MWARAHLYRHECLQERLRHRLEQPLRDLGAVERGGRLESRSQEPARASGAWVDSPPSTGELGMRTTETAERVAMGHPASQDSTLLSK